MLSRWRGTRRGLEMALELVTDGGVSRGELVLIEHWRLRRTMATILGADLADEDDPLLGGLAVSGNSLVGDTLVLGNEHRREFMALFGEESRSRTDEAWVRRFYARAAHRATVLAFEDTDPESLGLIRRVVAAECPAHVRTRVRTASRSFIVGMTALVGVDTRLGVAPPPLSVRLGSTRLGAGDRLRRPPALHPDVEGEGG